MKTGKMLVVLSALAAPVAAGGPAFAQSVPHGGMCKDGMQGCMQGKMMMKGSPGHGPDHGSAKGDQSAASLALQAVNEKMHRDMAIEFSGNADADFARAMIPHHQGAVDMAKIAIAFGKDPEIRKLAEEVVRTQEAEIAFMRDWLNKQGK